VGPGAKPQRWARSLVTPEKVLSEFNDLFFFLKKFFEELKAVLQTKLIK